jgi:hypothetical protein
MPAPIPAFKYIPGTGFSVDAFRYPSDKFDAYFLTHAHSGSWQRVNGVSEVRLRSKQIAIELECSRRSLHWLE